MAPAPDSPFDGAESYYAEHRPGYAPDAIGYLVERGDIGPDTRVLDLGCGTGQLTLPFARRGAAVVGMDPNPRMLRETRTRLDAAGLESVELVDGSDADLRDDAGPTVGPVRLATMGRSLHWMAQRPTLDHLRDRGHYRAEPPA